MVREVPVGYPQPARPLWGVQPQIVIIPAMQKVNDIALISALATNLLAINGKLLATTVAEFVA